MCQWLLLKMEEKDKGGAIAKLGYLVFNVSFLAIR